MKEQNPFLIIIMFIFDTGHFKAVFSNTPL
jgi:hypothetical protein